MRVVRAVDVPETDFFGLVSPDDNYMVCKRKFFSGGGGGGDVPETVAKILFSYSTEMDRSEQAT